MVGDTIEGLRGIDLQQVAGLLGGLPFILLGASGCKRSKRCSKLWVAEAYNHVRSMMAEEPDENCVLFVGFHSIALVDRIPYRYPRLARTVPADTPTRYDCHPLERGSPTT